MAQYSFCSGGENFLGGGGGDRVHCYFYGYSSVHTVDDLSRLGL